jgi:sugar O-acyltransferase (sialic acid O-acetyltransferase NeuD family)
MTKFTFLGSDYNALSMYIEVILSNYGFDIEIEIIQNMRVDAMIPYVPSGISCSETWVEDFHYQKSMNLMIGVISAKAKDIVVNSFHRSHGIAYTDYTSAIHNGAFISSSVKMGNGIMINPGVVVAPFVCLGNFVTINRNVSVGHHTTIGDFTSLNPGVNIAGGCQIGQNVTIGMGANILDKIKIGNNSIVGAGSVVTSNVPDNTLVYGVPAKVIRTVT